MIPPELVALVVALALTALLSLPVPLPGIDDLLDCDPDANDTGRPDQSSCGTS